MRLAVTLLLMLLAFQARAEMMLPVALPIVYGAQHAGLEGKRSLPLGQKVFVRGPLLQAAWPGGGGLTFHEGAIFEVAMEDGSLPRIHLLAGSVNASRDGEFPVVLSGPQGKVEVGPHSSINLQVLEYSTAGRVLRGQLAVAHADGVRVFGPQEGFELSAEGPRRTFTPPPAPSPSPANVEPGAGATRKENPTGKTEGVAVGDLLAPAMAVYQKIIRSLPAAPQPTAAEETPKVTLPPAVVAAQNDVAAAYPTPPAAAEPLPQPEPVPEPDVAGRAADPDPVRHDVYGAVTPQPTGVNQPNKRTSDAMGMMFSTGDDGEQRLEAMSAGQWVVVPQLDGFTKTVAEQTFLTRGSADHADTYSNGTVAGLGRWVGGQLVAATAVQGELHLLPTASQADNMGGTSTHYIWGEETTNAPTQGSINYTLKAATTPTYFGKNDSIRVPDQPADARFDGAMRVDFAPGSNNSIGRYHFNGTVTLTENGQTIGYGMATAASGVVLRNNQVGTEGSLKITPTNGPGIACGGGGSCTGAVMVAPYGSGVENLGALYSIRGSRSDIGINGAALFER